MPQHSDDCSEFIAYYEKHKKAIFNYLFYRVNFNRDTAEDLTSEVFLKAFEAFERYDRSRSFTTWIFSIAHNHLINFLIGKKDVLPLDEAREIAKEVHIGELVDQQTIVAKLLTLISKLPAAQRELVIMKYVNDLSNKEIAQITGKEEGAIRTAISRIIGKLRNEYQFHYLPLNESTY